jgi:hypothetical protein
MDDVLGDIPEASPHADAGNGAPAVGSDDVADAVDYAESEEQPPSAAEQQADGEAADGDAASVRSDGASDAGGEAEADTGGSNEGASNAGDAAAPGEDAEAKAADEQAEDEAGKDKRKRRDRKLKDVSQFKPTVRSQYARVVPHRAGATRVQALVTSA